MDLLEIMNIDYLNSLKICEVLSFYDRPIEFTIVDNCNNKYYCILYDCSIDNIDIFKIKNISNIYENDVILAEYCHICGKFKIIKGF